MRGPTPLLAALVALDLGLAAVGFVAPALWFSLIHDTPPDDPQAFLQRSAAAWLAFAAIQALALRRWRREPGWLLAVAGLRLGDALTDWTQLLCAGELTAPGAAALLVASPFNALAGLFLVRCHGAARAELTRSGAPGPAGGRCSA